MIEFVASNIGSSNEECIELFKKYKKDSEDIYVGMIPKCEISLSTSKEIYKDIETYFLKQLYRTNLVDDTFDPYLKKFVKLCWLTDEYLTKGFVNPLGVHYNPRLHKNIVHPGASRQQVLSLFHDTDIDCIFFNTNGRKYEWMKTLRKADITEFCADDVYITIVPDHGSLIPHMHLNQESIPVNVISYQKTIQERLLNFRISSNVEISILTPWANSKNPNVKLEFKKHYTEGDICRAIILSLLKKNYDCAGFTLICYN